jgi:predicted AlkP superfamily phosphohydrolase/phosphomutase
MTGAHRPYGFLLAVGPNIKSGETLKDGNIMDIAPTILRLLRESGSADLDGKVLADIFKNDA